MTSVISALRRIAAPIRPRFRPLIVDQFARLLAGYIRWKFPPLVIRPGTTDFQVFRQVFLTRDVLPVDARLIIDAGAYTGLSALWFAWRYPKARIIAIEPAPSNYRVLA